MPEPILGLHHVTAIASNPQRNLDFYNELLGLRLVKRTVNFDDPGTYHFDFGDDTGTPGTILTFFAWPHASRGSTGIGETSATAFGIPVKSLQFWEERLRAAGVPVEREESRLDHAILKFSDPDGVRLELSATSKGAMPCPHEPVMFRASTVSPVSSGSRCAKVDSSTRQMYSKRWDSGRPAWRAIGIASAPWAGLSDPILTCSSSQT